MTHNERQIGIIKTSARSELRVSRGEFKISFREWFKDRATGEMRPGRDGLEFPVSVAGEVVAALAK